jgi:hypothetical protein
MSTFTKGMIPPAFCVGLTTIFFTLWIPPPPASAAPAAIVTNGNDSGEGSLRAALASGASVITISDAVSQIDIESTLVYSKTGPLRIQGSGQSIVADGDYTLLAVSNGADLSLSNLDFHGIGGFSAESKGSGKGILVDVPSDRTGVVNLALDNVSVHDVANHGVHVSDCSLEDDCGSGGGGGGAGSSASIHARLSSVVIEGVGYGKFDADGVRVDDRGAGDIVFEAVGSSFVDVGADGVELDEGDAGDVIVELRDSGFDGNGGYCVIVEATPELDKGCFDDGELDLDDGFDIDEAADGSIYATVVNVTLDSNLDEGLDYDEEGAGDITADLVDIHTSQNGDEGVKCSEEGAGDLAVEIRSSSSVDNGDDGIQLESEDAGRTDASVHDTLITGSKKTGLNVSQDDDIELGTLEVRDSDLSDGAKLTNVELI